MVQTALHNPEVLSQPGCCLASYHFVPMLELFRPQCRTLHFFLLNLIKFLLSQSSTFWRFLWTTALPFCVSITPPHLTQSANLLTVPSASSYRPLPSCLCYVWKWISRWCSFSVTEVTINGILFPGSFFLPLWKTGLLAFSLFQSSWTSAVHPDFSQMIDSRYLFQYRQMNLIKPYGSECTQL